MSTNLDNIATNVDLSSKTDAFLDLPDIIIDSSNSNILTKKRGQPKGNEIKDTASWTNEMINALLEAQQDNMSLFLNAKDKKSIIRGWSRVTLTFNTMMKMDLSIEKIKSKYQNLQAVYRKISQTEIQMTGNMQLPKKPTYYDVLINHFGGREGMAHQCLTSSDQNDRFQEQNDLFDENIIETGFLSDENQNQSLISTPILTSSTNRSQIKKNKNNNVFTIGQDIKEGLVEISDRITSALITPQPLSNNNDLQKIKELLKEQATQNAETHQMLRTFMQAIMKNQ